MNLVIFWAEISNAWGIAQLQNELLKDLLNQTDQNYKCFIEYPAKDKVRFKQLEDDYSKYKNQIYFLERKGKKILGPTWKCRDLNDETLTYIKRQHDETTFSGNIMMVEAIRTVRYDKKFVEYMRNYKIKGNEKVLRFNKGQIFVNGRLEADKEYDSSMAFVYICDYEEYEKYFNPYTLVYGLNYEAFNNFPKRYISEVSYVRSV